jgi:hypothetical protein
MTAWVRVSSGGAWVGQVVACPMGDPGAGLAEAPGSRAAGGGRVSDVQHPGGWRGRPGYCAARAVVTRWVMFRPRVDHRCVVCGVGGL